MACIFGGKDETNLKQPPHAVLIDIKWTTARPNAVYKDISELFRGFSVYVAESEAECKMVQQKWKRSERATH